MARQSERHPTILRAIMRSDGAADLSSLAQEAGVSVKTIRRDILQLRKLGIPIEDRIGPNGAKTLYLDPTAIPLRFKYDEATALLWCCESLRSLQGTTWGASIQEAVEKIRAALLPLDRRYVDQMQPRMHRTWASGDYSARGDVVDALTLGIEDCRATFVTYHSANSTEPVTYDIHPYALAEHRGTLYVVGFSCHHNEIRTWKVDRMLEAAATQVPFSRPRDFDVKQHFEGAFAIVTGDTPITIRIRFTGTAVRYVQEKRMHASQQTKVLASGTAEVTFQLTSTFEIKSWILSFGSSAEVLEPETLRQEVIEELQAASAKYTDHENQPIRPPNTISVSQKQK
jgi:predicted DNA-binding transcriptional regulator YafY